MEMKDRIKWIRKERGMNQTVFGERFGVGQSTIAGYENGSRQPIDAVITSICREFSVSEQWLREGIGEPFVQKTKTEQIEDYFRDLEGLTPEFKKRLVSALAAIRPEDWDLIKQIVDKITANNMQSAASAGSDSSATVEDALDKITPEEIEVLRQLREKKSQAAVSYPLDTA